jgi:hypothetical protein
MRSTLDAIRRTSISAREKAGEQLERPLPASGEEQRTLLKPRALCLP